DDFVGTRGIADRQHPGADRERARVRIAVADQDLVALQGADPGLLAELGALDRVESPECVGQANEDTVLTISGHHLHARSFDPRGSACEPVDGASSQSKCFLRAQPAAPQCRRIAESPAQVASPQILYPCINAKG